MYAQKRALVKESISFIQNQGANQIPQMNLTKSQKSLPNLHQNFDGKQTSQKNSNFCSGQQLGNWSQAETSEYTNDFATANS